MLKAFEAKKSKIINFEHGNLTRSGKKRVRFWPFWGQKVDQKLLGTGPGGPLRVPGGSRPCLKVILIMLWEFKKSKYSLS